MDSPLSTLALPHLTANQDSSSALFSHLSRAAKNATSQSRAARNALYKHAQFLNSLPENVKAYHANNRNAEGLPRAYSIRFSDPQVDPNDPELEKLNRQTIIFGQHSDDGGILFNGHQVQPDETTFCAATKSWSFKTDVKSEEGVSRTDVGAHFSFETAQPRGILSVGSRAFNVHLDPKKVWYDVDVSANAGAYYSTGDVKLRWNTESDQWKNATWESKSMTFGVCSKNIGDELQRRFVPENTFIDNLAKPAKQFDLSASPATYPIQYMTTISSSTGKGPVMTTKVNMKPPLAPPERKDKPIKTVFPVLWEVQLTTLADHFTGAYQDYDGNVYAVSGTARLDDDASLLSMLSVPRTELPVEDLYAVSPRSEESINVGSAPIMHSIVAAPATRLEDDNTSFTSSLMAAENAATEMKVAAAQDRPPLQVWGLLNLNPMVRDSSDSSGFRDSVATVAMNDFHDLIVYFMEEDLRLTFVQATAPMLTASVLSIAHDDVAQNNNENQKFYRKLQVPFIVSMLSQGTLPQAKQCNGARANAKLKDIPTHDPVYQRHSTKLYTARYKAKFPAINDFLEDQRQNQRMHTAEKFANKMKTSLENKSEGLKDSNPKYDEQLANAKKDIDNLIVWANERYLYWAIELLYYVQRSLLPIWFMQYTSGSSSSSLGMMHKQLNALFGLLEDNAINTKPGGRNFMQAFNEDVRLFQMTAVVPSLIDMDGNTHNFDNIMVQCLDDYTQLHKFSPDERHKEAVTAAQELSSQKELRTDLWRPLAEAQQNLQAFASWGTIMEKWQAAVKASARYQNLLQKGAPILRCFQAGLAAVLVIIGFMPGARDKWTQGQKAQWGAALGGLCGMFVIRLAQGVLRLAYLWNDVAGLGNSLKCVLGFEKVVDEIENASQRFQGSFAKFFSRTSKQTLKLAEQEASELIGEKGFSNFSTVERLLGRNMGEVIGTVCGLSLAIVSIVMTSIDLANQHDGLLITMDIIMTVSAVIQILGVAAGWILIVGAAAAGTAWATIASYSIVSLCATWAGPVAIVFAIIGLIVFLVWYSKQDHRDPIDKFLDDRAEPEGLRMGGEKQAPEYFGLVPAAATNPSLVGLSVRGPFTSVEEYQTWPAKGNPLPPDGSAQPFRYAKLKIDTSKQHFMALDVDTKAPKMVDKVDNSLDTVWSLETNADGKSLIYTASLKKGLIDENGTPAITRTLWYLATSDDNSRVELREMPGKDTQKKRDAVMEHARWTIDVLETPTMKEGQVMNAMVNISQNKAQLGRWVDRRSFKMNSGLATAAGDKTITGDKAFPDTMLCAGWLLSMAPIGPSGFSYAKKDWRLTDSDRDLRNVPRFFVSGVSSDGLEWKIQPALDPECFELVKGPGLDEGIIRQIRGKKPKLMAPTKYKVSCTLVVDKVASDTRTTEVTIEVVKNSRVM